jgi:PEP-CTERM motif
MNTLSKVAAVLLATSTTFFSSSVMAQASSTAAVSDTRYQLIDLDATDGIAPTITFFGTSNTSGARVFTGNSSDGYSSTATRNSTSTRAISVSIGDGNASADASYSGDNFGSLFSAGQVSNLGNFGASQSFSSSFTLAPNTLLLVLGRMSGKVVGGMYYDQYASSSASISLSGNLTSSGGYQSSQFYTGANTLFSGSSQYNSEFGLSFINGTTSEITGSYSVATSVEGVNNVVPAVPVPEPETYAMMLAGLGLLGFVARRKKAVKLA